MNSKIMDDSKDKEVDVNYMLLMDTEQEHPENPIGLLIRNSDVGNAVITHRTDLVESCNPEYKWVICGGGNPSSKKYIGCGAMTFDQWVSYMSMHYGEITFDDINNDEAKKMLLLLCIPTLCLFYLTMIDHTNPTVSDYTDAIAPLEEMDFCEIINLTLRIIKNEVRIMKRGDTLFQA